MIVTRLEPDNFHKIYNVFNGNTVKNVLILYHIESTNPVKAK